jgi:hypothetical protein
VRAMASWRRVGVYTAERLHAAGETSIVQPRHRERCLSFAERATSGLTGPKPFAWFRLLPAERENVRAALDACGDEPTPAESELRMAEATGRFWWPRKSAEGRGRLAAALIRAPATPNSAQSAARYWQGSFEVYSGGPAIGQDLSRASLTDAPTRSTEVRRLVYEPAKQARLDERPSPDRCAMPTRRTRSNATPLSTWCRPHSVMRRSLQLAAIRTLGQLTAPRAICLRDGAG